MNSDDNALSEIRKGLALLYEKGDIVELLAFHQALHRLAQAFISLAQGLGLESIVDPDAVDATLFGDILSLVYDGLAARASR